MSEQVLWRSRRSFDSSMLSCKVVCNWVETSIAPRKIVEAMDTAIGQGFDDIGFAEPASLSVRFVR